MEQTDERTMDSATRTKITFALFSPATEGRVIMILPVFVLLAQYLQSHQINLNATVRKSSLDVSLLINIRNVSTLFYLFVAAHMFGFTELFSGRYLQRQAGGEAYGRVHGGRHA